MSDINTYMDVDDTGYVSSKSATAVFRSPLTSTPMQSKKTTVPQVPATSSYPAPSCTPQLFPLVCNPVINPTPCQPSTCSSLNTTDVKPIPANVSTTSSGLPTVLPFPKRFSVRVETAISAGNVLPVRRYLIADVGSFYLGLTSHPSPTDYKRVAVLLCEKFPELKDGSSEFWVINQLYYFLLYWSAFK